MTDDGSRADVEVQPVGEALFRAVLVLGLSRGAQGEDPIRIPLAGEHPTAEEACAAAQSAIKAMAEGRQ